MNAAQAITTQGLFMGDRAGELIPAGCARARTASSELSYLVIYSLFVTPDQVRGDDRNEKFLALFLPP